MILSTDLVNKLKELFNKKKFTEIDFTIESLGDLEKLPNNILNLYAVSKALNPHSKESDFRLSAYLFEKIFSADKSNREAFYNLIVTSVKAIHFSYLEKHLVNEYNKNNNDPKILEGLAKMNFFYNNMKEASIYYEKLVTLKPEYANVWSSFIASLNYHYHYDQREYLEFCKKFDETLNIEAEEFKAGSKKNKKIRIGFISADFKNHSVSLFLKEILNKLDKTEFELFGFSNLQSTFHDGMTSNLKKIFDNWYDVFDLTDVEFLQLTRSCNLDIILDLSGHTYQNRINVLKARCAPIQISWLGYCNTLGVKNIDYLIADPHLIKEEEQNLYSEKILYMPNIWNALSKPINLPNIENDKEKDIFTYGSFNNFQKISLETIKLWSKILNENNSKLILKTSASFNNEKNKDILLKKFANEQVDLKKIIILDRKISYEEHLACYNKIDLSLDTFPYPGVTTSFQSLVMGVPVLTMKGFNFNSRCGESINYNVNSEELIAKNEKEYFDKALNIQKANNINLNYRHALREKVLESNLFDTETFTKDFVSLIKSL